MFLAYARIKGGKLGNYILSGVTLFVLPQYLDVGSGEEA